MAVTLSRRLAAAATWCRGTNRVVDVGCDHGKLCAYLLEKDWCCTAVATDIHPQPLQKAETLLSELGLCDRVQFHCTDGLDGIPLYCGDVVVIAGVGADVTSSILTRVKNKLPDELRFVLVPASRHEQLRSWLWDNGFTIEEETAVTESGHHYTVMQCRYNGASRSYTLGDAVCGLIRPEKGDGHDYLTHQKTRYERLMNTPCGSDKQAEAREILCHIKALLTGEEAST